MGHVLFKSMKEKGKIHAQQSYALSRTFTMLRRDRKCEATCNHNRWNKLTPRNQNNNLVPLATSSFLFLVMPLLLVAMPLLLVVSCEMRLSH